MNLEKVVFGFFVVLAATLNFGFFIGDLGDPELHNAYELYAAIFVNLIATVLKFGDRTQMGAVHLATSLVADLQLIAAALVWGFAYVLIWEGAVARTARGAARLSINVHARSLVARIAHHKLPINGSSTGAALAVPLVVAVLAVALTIRWLATADVA